MKLIINNTVKAFLCNLSSRALHLRSFVSSYYLAKKITFHNFTGDRNKTYCEECYKYYIIGDDFYGLNGTNQLNINRIHRNLIRSVIGIKGLQNIGFEIRHGYRPFVKLPDKQQKQAENYYTEVIQESVRTIFFDCYLFHLPLFSQDKISL